MVTDSKPLPGTDEIRLPGQIEMENKQRTLSEGIALPADVGRALAQACHEAGVTFVAPTTHWHSTKAGDGCHCG